MADVSKFLAKADEALKKRNYDYAIQMYESAMEADPGNADARRNFRLALVRKYDAEGYPKSFGFGGMATKVLAGKNAEKLLVETEKLVAKDPKSIKYNLRVAETLAALKYHDAAVAVLEFAAKAGDLKEDKQGPNLLMLLAKEYSEVGKVTEANNVLARATRLAPNDKHLKELQKELSAKTYNAKVGSAKGAYDLVQNRDEADLLEKMRKGNITEEDAQALIEAEEKKLQANPLDRRAILNIAEVLAKRKKYNEAADRLYAFLKLDPSANDIGDKAAKYKTMWFDGVIQLCAKRAQEDPAKANAYKAKANEIREEKKKWQLDEYGRGVEAAPTDLDKRYLYGQALLDAGNQQEAFKQFQKAKGSPKYAKKANLLMGQCLLSMGRVEMAEMAFQEVEKLLSDGDEEMRKELMYFEAHMLEQKGDPAAALDKFRALYMEDMEFRDIEKCIERLKSAVGA